MAVQIRNSAGRVRSVSVVQLEQMACALMLLAGMGWHAVARGDSVNSSNITMNVDANRSAGNGAGNVSVAVNTITLAETNVNEYSSGATRAVTVAVRPGFQFDPSSNVTAQSAGIGFNGGGVNVAATVTPAGVADEVITFSLTSGTTAGQDIIRINGIKLRILSAIGAAGPAQTTMSMTTSTAGGAFTDQGIVAATITKGAADRLVFSIQPGTNQAAADLLPTVTMVDFGGNIVTADPRTISVALQDDPGNAPLLGTVEHLTVNGVATWEDADNLRITTAASGYTLRASHSGGALLTSDTVDSAPFDITAGDPGQLVVTKQPVSTAAGSDILIDVTAQDLFGNPITATSVSVTLDSAINPGGWPLLVDTSLTKSTVNGVASWAVADHLRINKQITGYRLSASGIGGPVVTNAFDITPGSPDHLLITQQPVDTVAGVDLFTSVTVKDRFDNTVTATAVPVALSLGVNPGGAALLASSSLTKNTIGGVATWDGNDDLRITAAASGYRIAATGTGVGSVVQTDAFEIIAAAPGALRFVQQPTNTQTDATMNPPVTVQVTDAFGNTTAVAVPVTLNLLSAPCGGVLTNAQATSAAGLATFNTFSIDTACAGNVLVANSSGLVSAFSSAFDITEPPEVTPPPAAPGLCGAGAATAVTPLLLAATFLRRRRSSDTM